MFRSPTVPLRKTATIVATAICAGLWAGAIPANAATYCVQKPSCVGTEETDLQAALDTAKLNPGHDDIEIGQGTFVSQDPYVYSAFGSNTVNVIGEGPADTRLVTTATGSVTTLTLVHGSASDLGVVGPNGSAVTDFPIALTLTGTAERVKVTGGYSGVHLLTGASLRDSVVSGSGLDYDRPAVLFAGSKGTILDSVVSGTSTGIVGSHPGQFTVSRCTVAAQIGVSAGEGANVDIDDSLIRSSYTGLNAYAFAQPATLVARNVTISGPGTGSGVGVWSLSGGAGQTANVVLQNSAVSNFQHSLKREASAGAALITVKNDDYDPSTVTASGIGNVTDLGGNTDAAPGFVDAAGGDFRLAPGSALIDAGTDSVQGGLSSSDRDRGARSVDGNGDGTAVPDIGAYEFVPAPPADPPAETPSEPAAPTGPGTPGTPTPPAVPAAPQLSALSFSPRRFRAVTVAAPHASRRARRGSRLRFTLSEDAKVRVIVKRVRRGRAARSAGRVTISGRAGANSSKFNGRVGKRVLKPGKYVALVTATDAGGRRSAQRRVRFTILAR